MPNYFQTQLKTRQADLSNKPKLVWLLNDWLQSQYRTQNDLYGGIGYYRVIKPAQVLSRWFDIDVVGADIRTWGTTDETYTRLGRDYDLIIAKHIMDGQTASNILGAAKHFKRKVIVDIDDNYFDIRKDNPALNDYALDKPGRYYVGAFLALADGITVSTEPLKQIYQKLNKNVDVLPNCNDVLDWPVPVRKNDGIIRIGYAGGTAHNEDLDLIVEPIAKILEKYPNTTFEVIGALGPQKAREIGSAMLKFAGHKILDRFKIMGGTQAWQGYPQLLTQQGWDIGLAPLTNDKFNEGKSHIKWMEYTCAGIAVVASPIYPYKEPIQGIKVIEHGKTGLFANSSEEWLACLEMLIKNPDVKRKLVHNAYKYICDNWQWQQQAFKFKDVILKYL